MTKNQNSIKILKGSTLGFWKKANFYNLQNEPFLCVEEESDQERVFLEDHKTDHINNGEIKDKLENLLDTYSDVFSKTPKYMGKTDLAEHLIDVGDAPPIKIRAYRVSHKGTN